jgi:hypothetical protein
VHFNIKNGSSALMTVILMLVIVSVTAFGLIILMGSWDQRVVNSTTDPNLTGITYTSDVYNATNSTLHGLTNVMPNFIWIVVIFLFVVFFTLFVIALKHR